MTNQELQEQAEKMYPINCQDKGNCVHEWCAIKLAEQNAWTACAKWMQEQDKWISVDTPPMKPNGVSELYVLASEDEDCLTVEKVFYDTKDNTYWIPFCKEQYFPKWYCYLPSPPKTK